MVSVGINWTSPRDHEVIRLLAREGVIDFVEVMIDNFLLAEPESFSPILNNIQCSFHIMNSRFVHRTDEELTEMASKVLFLRDALQPIYLSDHMGVFYRSGQQLPRMAEVDYANAYELVCERVVSWQKTLGEKVFFENYPSVVPLGAYLQPGFFEALVRETSCGVLFDISNADIAEQNTAASVDDWHSVLPDDSVFHIGGYDYSTIEPKFAVDTHNTNVSSSSLEIAKRFLGKSSARSASVVVERDDNLNVTDWLADIRKVKSVCGR